VAGERRDKNEQIDCGDIKQDDGRDYPDRDRKFFEILFHVLSLPIFPNMKQYF
jgi:hypothetical protein